MSFLRLVICVSGVYSMFLIWAIAQERLSVSFASKDGLSSDKFRSILLMNTCQSALSAVSSFLYLTAFRKPSQSIYQALGLGHSHFHHDSIHAKARRGTNGLANDGPKIHTTVQGLLVKYFQCAALLTIAQPFGFASLSYISYPAMILGKSCKLVPVMLMNVLLYRRRFPPYKYVVVVMVTAGITLFMGFGNEGRKTANNTSTSSLFGLVLLLVNLILDGATYSTQDEIIATYHVSGQQMMFFMNCFATVLTSVVAVLPLPYIPVIHPSGGSTELEGALNFVRNHPQVTLPLIQFAVTGSLGQLFIFETLRNFGSLTLVKITLTRKMFTMLLSVAMYNHRLTFGQWLGVLVVFGGISVEAWMRRQELIFKQQIKPKQK